MNQYYECVPCQRKAKEGKFCVQCGKDLTIVRVKSGIKCKPIMSGRKTNALMKAIRKWLTRINIANSDIQIETGDGVATVKYVAEGKQYSFTSVLQKDERANLAAVEQFLHYRVLGIERGIESLEQAFAGYVALPDKTDFTSFSLQELRAMLSTYHPDTSTGEADVGLFNKVLDEIRGRVTK